MPKKANDLIDRQVGEKLRARRQAMRFSQSWVAKQLGITFQQVQKYETGRNRIGAGRLQGIARVLDVPIAYFFDDTANLKGDEMTRLVEQFSAMSDGRALAAAYQKLSNPKLRARVVSLVRAYADC